MITAYLLTAAFPTSPLLQTDSGSTDQGESEERTDEEKRGRLTSMGEDSDASEDDRSYLKQKRKQINSLIEQHNFGDARDVARKTLDHLFGTRLVKDVADLIDKVNARAEAAYREVRKEARRYRTAKRPYRAYKTIKKEVPNFEGTDWKRRLTRQLQDLKSDVADAYREGRLDEKPSFLRSSEQKQTEQEKSDDSDGSGLKITIHQTPSGSKELDRKENPRLYAEGECMSNARRSPKAFEGEVVSTTGNGVYFRVDFKGADSRDRMGYFLFELRGLKGREKVRIDFVNMGRWSNSRTIVPMFSRGVEELSDLGTLRGRPPEDGKLEYVKTEHGQKVPKTKGLQKWHYFKNVERKEDERTLVVRKRIPEETARIYVTHRTPYTFGYHRNYMDHVKERARYGAEGLTVHDVGESALSNPLHIVELENPTDPEAKKKPVVVMIGGEHPDEHATYQSVRGAISWLISDSRIAKALRRKATFLFVPVMDPDGLVQCMYENKCYTYKSQGGFVPGSPSCSSRKIGKWFRQWANRGCRLDVIINAHNVESGENAVHLFNYLVEPEPARNEMSRDIWRYVQQSVKQAGFRVKKAPSGTGYVPNRLGGFLRKFFGTMQVFVELNTQPREPARVLTLEETHLIGRELVSSVVEYLYSRKAAPLLRSIEKTRRDRRKLVERYQWFIDREDKFIFFTNVFKTEKRMWFMPIQERYVREWRNLKEKKDTRPMALNWVKELYRKPGISETNIPEVDW